MCGIAGIYNFARKEPVDEQLLKQMGDVLEHRGPDDAGHYRKGNIGLTMRRLSVIDLSTGHQPMASDDGRIQLIFNGEIYNFQHLRTDLISQGVRFRTNSDTEVILRLYEREGVDCVKQLRGMFAFAIWDEPRDRLMLARDRIGKKPLVYAYGGGQLAWASEIRSLLKIPALSKEIDLDAIDLYLGLQYIPSPWTAYKSIRKLPPAQYLLVERGNIRLEKYWELPTKTNDTSLSFEEAKKILREKIMESTKLRMVSDVPLGAFLSGGIDSTVVVGAMSRLSSRPIKTFSVGFEEEKFSELAFARQVAAFFKTDHTEIIVQPQITEVLPKLAWHYGEPFGDSSALPTYYLARETRKHVTVALSGDGGDENFAGYKRYAAMKMMRHLDKLPISVRRSLVPLGDLLPRKGRRFMQDILAKEPAEHYFNLIGAFGEREKVELYTPEFSQSLSSRTGTMNYMNTLFCQSQNKDFVNQLLAIDFSSYLPDCLMTKVDIATMAHSLEARSPLLDHELIEFVWQLPSDWKLKGYSLSKWIMKEALKDMLPPSIVKRPKMGFGLPIDAWFRGELKNYWRDIVLSSVALNRGYFQKEGLKNLIDDHVGRRRNLGYRLWTILMLELWHLVGSFE